MDRRADIQADTMYIQKTPASTQSLACGLIRCTLPTLCQGRLHSAWQRSLRKDTCDLPQVKPLSWFTGPATKLAPTVCEDPKMHGKGNLSGRAKGWVRIMWG